MQQHFEWRDNDYELGLFTFYRESNSLSPEPKNPERSPQAIAANKIKTKLNTKKQPQHKRYLTEYMYWSIDKHAQSSKKAKPLMRINTSEKKMHQIRQSQSPNKEQKLLMLRKDTRIKNKSLLELKKRNINEIFKFDIIRDRTKMFVYRGERAEESIKAERERELVNDCDIHTDHMLDRFIDKGSGHKLNKLANAPKISIYSNFVQLLVEKRKKQRERSGQKKKQKLDVALQKLQRGKTILSFFRNPDEIHR